MRLQRLQVVACHLTIGVAAAAAAVALVLAVAIGQYAPAIVVLAALLVRFQAPSDRWRHVGAIGLVLAVAAVVGVSGGPEGSVLVLLLLVLAGYGVMRSARWVMAVGGAAALVLAGTAVAVGGFTVTSPAWMWSLLTVPLVGLAAGQLCESRSLEGTAALMSSNAALDEVLQLAERMPAGFDRWSVGRTVQLEIAEACELPVGTGSSPHLLIVHQGVLFGVGAPLSRQPVGLLDDLPQQRSTQTWTRVETAELPAPLAEHLPERRWYLHLFGGDGRHAVVLVPQDLRPEALDAVSDVLRPASVVLANVDRFERLEDLAVRAARVRVAHDLHDGIAQALTHVRFELDLLGLEHSEMAADVEGIRRVADAALLEVRRTVGELREWTPFSDRIERHVELLATFAAGSIELELPAVLEVPDDVADDLFRLAQEALSNAVRHAEASTIKISFDQQPTSLGLAVIDNGTGMGSRVRRGVGLGAMESRARRLGGELLVRDRRGGGTVVEVDVPIPRRDGSSEKGQPDEVVSSQ